MRKSLTTGQVAKLCGVAPRTVTKWLDRGEIRGYRIPGSQDRRFPRAAVIEFMRAAGMSDALEELLNEGAVLLVGAPAAVADAFDAAGRRVLEAAQPFAAGLHYQAAAPVFVFIDFGVGTADALAVADAVASRPSPPPVVGAVCEDFPPGEVPALAAAHHFARTLRKPYDPAEVVAAFQELLAAPPPPVASPSSTRGHRFPSARGNGTTGLDAGAAPC